jgi:hypothetical protein
VTDADFFPVALPYALQVHTSTGVLTSVLLAQCADETGYGGPDWTVAHNPGNVGSFDNVPVHTFPTLEAGTLAWAQTYKNGLYGPVLAAVGWQDQCIALGESPWSSAHYDDGNGPGSALIWIVVNFNLTRYDTEDIMGIAASANSFQRDLYQEQPDGSVKHWWQVVGQTSWHGPDVPTAPAPPAAPGT